ncbi:light-inducible protein [Candidatus Fermentibacteria bacterium]|nr:light-inducible protein [Candidatus Fermentibacteria bacterium]
MPLARISTNAPLDETAQGEICRGLSEILSREIGKPEQYIMTVLENCRMLMSARDGNAAFVDVRSIGGLSPEVNTAVSSSVCDLLKAKADVPPERIYVVFTDVPRESWAWKGSTFG